MFPLHTIHMHTIILYFRRMEVAQVTLYFRKGEVPLPSKVLTSVWANEKPTRCKFLHLPEMLASLYAWKILMLKLNLFQHKFTMDKREYIFSPFWTRGNSRTDLEVRPKPHIVNLGSSPVSTIPLL